ncbi:hypothetical protein ACKKBG_A15550 [Auxenochlorella protothecoides x Auxenochlorella symbiontica]
MSADMQCLRAFTVMQFRKFHSVQPHRGEPEAGCSIEEIKKAAKRTGDAAKDWIAGSNSHASQAMRVASENAEQVYESAKRALDETQTIGKDRAEKVMSHLHHGAKTSTHRQLPDSAKESIAQHASETPANQSARPN